MGEVALDQLNRHKQTPKSTLSSVSSPPPRQRTKIDGEGHADLPEAKESEGEGLPPAEEERDEALHSRLMNKARSFIITICSL